MKRECRYLEQDKESGGFVRFEHTVGAPFASLTAACYGRICDNSAAMMRCLKRLRKWKTNPGKPTMMLRPLDIDKEAQFAWLYRE